MSQSPLALRLTRQREGTGIVWPRAGCFRETQSPITYRDAIALDAARCRIRAPGRWGHPAALSNGRRITPSLPPWRRNTRHPSVLARGVSTADAGIAAAVWQ